jgi:hypothetical protein
VDADILSSVFHFFTGPVKGYTAMIRPLLLTLLASGCFQITLDFHCQDSSQCGGGFCNSQKRCDFSSQEDLAGIDFSGVDLSSPDLAGVDIAGIDLTGFDLQRGDMAQSPCTPPILYVTVEKLGSMTLPGKILRYSLATGTPKACSSLNGSGSLGQFPEAIAPFGSGLLAVGARDGVFIVDPVGDIVTASWYNNPQALFPVDVVPLQTSDGTELAVAWSGTGDGPAIVELDLYLPSMSSGPKHAWLMNNDLHISNALGATIDPWDPTQLMILDDNLAGNPQAEEYLEPFGDTITPHYGEPSVNLSSIAAITVGGVSRIVWAGAIAAYDGVYYRNEGTASDTTSAFFGPAECSCHMLYAVPDPNDNKTAFALCEGTGSSPNTVYRVTYQSGSVNGACSAIVNDDQLGTDFRISHLAIQMP